MSNLNQRPVIIGNGGHARSLLSMAPDDLRPVAYVDPENGLPLQWLGNDTAFLSEEKYSELPVIIAYIAGKDCSLAKRRAIIEMYSHRRFSTVIAPDAIVASDTVVGNGTMIFHRAVVNTGVFLGNHVVINTGAIVEHDVTIGENVFIGPGAIICGGVTVGNDTYIGAGACLKNGITVAANVVVGLGAVVVSDIREPGTYVGNPARKI